MEKYTWVKTDVPQELPVRQVYGVVFSDSGKVLLRVDGGEYKLTGGKPEQPDNSFAETLKREYLEELNVEITEIYYLGYLLVEENEARYAQIRMIAKIKHAGAIRPDPDNGKTYQRFWANPNDVKGYLAYPDSAGNQMIDDAIAFGAEKYDLKF